MIPIAVHTGALNVFAEKKLSGKYCLDPFIVAKIELDGAVRICGCTSWMPITIGNIFDNTLANLLNSKLAQDIRDSIIKGTYKFCNESTCGIIRNNLLATIDNLPESVLWQIQDSTRWQMPYEIVFSGDLTCNLSCPSCRTKVIKLERHQIKQQLELADVVRRNIFSNPTDQEINITLSTSGELFASEMLLSFVNKISLIDFPNVFLKIQTNGLLASKNWSRLGELQNRVRLITVTIDAASADTYEKLRRGGKWPQIMSAMAWLQAKKKENSMRIHTRMVVQKDNYHEVEDFYHMSKKLDADRVEYARISDWHVMDPDVFRDLDVLNDNHALYPAAVEFWKKVKDFPDVVSWG